MQMTADISKIWKTVRHDLTIIFDVLLEYVINFASTVVFLARVSFT